MSKTIDALKRPDIRSQVHGSFHEEIADTYFKKPLENVRKKTASKLPWLITALALIALFTALISKSNIDIRVRVLNEDTPVLAQSGQTLFGSFQDKCVYFLKGPEINNSLISRTYFGGDAQVYSRLTGSGVALRNSRGSGWASYTIEFKEPVDLTDLEIGFTASGERGDERVGVAIVDSGNRTYRMEEDRLAKLTKNEKIYKADFRSAASMVDLDRVSAIRFEFGTLTVGNGSTAAILLNSVYASKTKKAARWL